MHILWKTYQVWILIIGPDNFIFKDILVFYVFVPTSIRLVITLYKKGLCIVLERLFILNNTDSSISIVLCLLSLSSSCLLSESSLSSPFSSSLLSSIFQVFVTSTSRHDCLSMSTTPNHWSCKIIFLYLKLPLTLYHQSYTCSKVFMVTEWKICHKSDNISRSEYWILFKICHIWHSENRKKVLLLTWVYIQWHKLVFWTKFQWEEKWKQSCLYIIKNKKFGHKASLPFPKDQTL